MVSRRGLLFQGAAAPFMLRDPGNAVAAAPRALPSLKGAAERIGLAIGSDSDVDFRKAPPAYLELFIAQCGLYAGLFDWRDGCHRPNDPCLADGDPNTATALARGLRLSGGHLMWHGTTPGWFGDGGSASLATEAMLRHVTGLVRRYAGRVYSWNVFNEVFNPREGRPDGLRGTPALRALGPDHFDAAFRAARAADPAALLVLNEYALEMATDEHEAKRAALLRWLDKMQRRGTPIDAVGVQSHLKLDGSRFDPELFRRFLRDIAARDLRILITELDVLDLATRGSEAKRDAAVASLYGEYLRTALDEPAVAAVVIWGLSDRYTWLTPQNDARFARADGQPARPLPFDADFQPKPAFHAIIDALAHAPQRASVRQPPSGRSGQADGPEHPQQRE